MIVLKRDDGMALNLSSAISFMDHKRGLVVEMPSDNEGSQHYITSIESLDALQEIVEGRFATMITILGTFEGWP